MGGLGRGKGWAPSASIVILTYIEKRVPAPFDCVIFTVRLYYCRNV